MRMQVGCVQFESGGDAARSRAFDSEGGGLFDALDIPIIVLRCDGVVLRANRAATDVLGLAFGDIGRNVGGIPALKNIESLESLCAQVVEDAAPCRRDLQIGDRRFVLRLAPCLGTSGHADCSVLTFTNVTAFRESIEQAIYEREYTKTILNTVTEPLAVLDSELRVQTANRAFYEMFGVSRQEAQGTPLTGLARISHSAVAKGLLLVA